MTLDSFVLPVNPINYAVQDITDALTSAKDFSATPKTMLASCLRGLDAIMADVIRGQEVGEEECPCVRLFVGSQDYPIETVELFTIEGYVMMHLYFIFYIPDTTNFATGKTFESVREDFIRHAVRYIEYPTNDTGNNYGLIPDRVHWRFPISGWTLYIDNDTPLKYFGRDINIKYPYFISRVDIKIEVINYQVTG